MWTRAQPEPDADTRLPAADTRGEMVMVLTVARGRVARVGGSDVVGNEVGLCVAGPEGADGDGEGVESAAQAGATTTRATAAAATAPTTTRPRVTRTESHGLSPASRVDVGGYAASGCVERMSATGAVSEGVVAGPRTQPQVMSLLAVRS
jgi:hypothetical protein